MADKHTFGEALESQCLGSLEMAIAETHAVIVDDVGLTVEYAGFVVVDDEVSKMAKSVGLMELVARVEKNQIIALGPAYAFVLRIIKPFVRL